MSLSSMGQGNGLPRSKSNPPLGRPARRHRPTTPFLIRRYNGLDEGVQPAKSQRTANANPEVSILTAAVHSGVVSQTEVARPPYKKRWNVDSVTQTF